MSIDNLIYIENYLQRIWVCNFNYRYQNLITYKARKQKIPRDKHGGQVPGCCVRMCRLNIGLDISIDVHLHQSIDLFYNYIM